MMRHIGVGDGRGALRNNHLGTPHLQVENALLNMQQLEGALRMARRGKPFIRKHLPAPQLNHAPVVDLYNAISIRYAIPVGGENVEAYVGQPRLVVADGNELFDTVNDGEMAHESPEPGEVVWRDDLGVTCRRWNWRQGVRTRLNADAGKMWFILESLPAMPLQALFDAGEELTKGLHQMMPGVKTEQTLIGFDLAEEHQTK